MRQSSQPAIRLPVASQSLGTSAAECLNMRPCMTGHTTTADMGRDRRRQASALAELPGLVLCRASKLSLASVSLVLAKASGQGVPLPMAAVTVAPADASACGPTPSHMHPVADQTPSIASFGPSVSVLNSKTRPKKLQLTASDGSQHSFLLKAGALPMNTQVSARPEQGRCPPACTLHECLAPSAPPPPGCSCRLSQCMQEGAPWTLRLLLLTWCRGARICAWTSG